MTAVTERLIPAINAVLWGVPMLILLMGCGIYFSLRLRFLQITHIRIWIKETFGTIFKKNDIVRGGISPYRAVSSALASSIGTGSIIGVATAIAAGGPGAVFWMWVSAIFGMATKFAEVFLAVKFRVKINGCYRGGPMYYIERGIGNGYRWLSYLFAVSGSLACLGMGAMSQANSIANVAKDGLDVPFLASGIILGIIAFGAVSGGISRISSLAGSLVPIMACAYLAAGIAIFAMRPYEVAEAFSEILKSVFMPRAIYGAAAGEMFRRALRFGIARGVFSNEAGLGSSPIVHAAAEAKSPITQGFWGIFEVFVDTMIVCTVTAIVIIASGAYKSNLSGVALVSRAFSEYFGGCGGAFVGIATVLFSLTTILGWSYYGEQCAEYILKNKKSAGYFYRALFVVAVIAGACLSLESVWEISDMFNGMMAVPNIIALLILSETVIRNTREYFR